MSISPSTKRAVIKGVVANVVNEHREAPDLATRIAYAVMEALAELDDPADHDACIHPHRTADDYADCDGRPL